MSNLNKQATRTIELDAEIDYDIDRTPGDKWGVNCATLIPPDPASTVVTINGIYIEVSVRALRDAMASVPTGASDTHTVAINIQRAISIKELEHHRLSLEEDASEIDDREFERDPYTGEEDL